MSDEIKVTLEDVLHAKDRIRDYINATDVLESDNIGHQVGARIFFKLESMQKCKSFKFRGAINKMLTLPEGSTVVTCSAGNHGQAVACAADYCNCKSIIYMPDSAPSDRVGATKYYKGSVIQAGDMLEDAMAVMDKELAKHDDWVHIHPYNDKEIIAACGTIGLELFDQIDRVETIVVPIGGGGLISGIALAVKSIKPSIRIIGVKMEYKSLFINGNASPLAFSLAINKTGQSESTYISKYVDQIVDVSEDEVALAIALLAERAKVIAEGAAAATLAAVMAKKFEYKKGEKICCIVSGGNIPLKMLSACIDRALFVRKDRILCSIIVPYGTVYLTRVTALMAQLRAEVVSCMSSPHVDTVANKESYTLILDIDNPDVLVKINDECEQRGWIFKIRSYCTH